MGGYDPILYVVLFCAGEVQVRTLSSREAGRLTRLDSTQLSTLVGRRRCRAIVSNMVAGFVSPTTLEDKPYPYKQSVPQPARTNRGEPHTHHRRFSSSIGSHFFYITYLLNQQYLSVLKLQHYIKEAP